MTLIRNFFLVLSTTLGIICFICLAACGTSSSPTTEGTSEAPKAPSRSIHEGAFLGDLSLVQAHIAAGTDLNIGDDFGSSPLIIATTFGKTAVAKQLIAAGADVNFKGADGGTALHGAAFYCRTEILEALLAKGAELNVRNQYGATALESVDVPFEAVESAYDQISKDLGPLGFKLDYDYLKATRPKVAEMIRQAQ
ncbi:MAG: ankyrin repeat domain-containing protein [Bacteroidota bacterium]